MDANRVYRRAEPGQEDDGLAGYVHRMAVRRLSAPVDLLGGGDSALLRQP